MNEVRARSDRVVAEWDSNPGRVALAQAVAETIRTATRGCVGGVVHLPVYRDV